MFINSLKLLGWHTSLHRPWSQSRLNSHSLPHVHFFFWRNYSRIINACVLLAQLFTVPWIVPINCSSYFLFIINQRSALAWGCITDRICIYCLLFPGVAIAYQDFNTFVLHTCRTDYRSQWHGLNYWLQCYHLLNCCIGIDCVADWTCIDCLTYLFCTDYEAWFTTHVRC